MTKTGVSAKDEINVPIALGAFRDKGSKWTFLYILYIQWNLFDKTHHSLLAKFCSQDQKIDIDT